jgi:DNA-binding response OmpR family regulator
MGEKILIIEDDEKLARMIELELGHEDYETEKAADGISGLKAAEDGAHDLILLDIMLPGMSGIEVLRRLRKSKDTPVILLTARDETVDKVLGLDSGADDYVTKPFAIEELLARIRAAMRKSQKTGDADAEQGGVSGGMLEYSGLVVSKDAHKTVFFGENASDETAVELTHKEFELLVCLLENKGRVMSRDALLNKVWGYDFIGETNVVDVYIRFLRSKIDERFDTKIITTVRGAGYRIG